VKTVGLIFGLSAVSQGPTLNISFSEYHFPFVYVCGVISKRRWLRNSMNSTSGRPVLYLTQTYI